MIVDVFLDTNIIAYAASKVPSDNAKREIAVRLIETTAIGLSAQVLQEFYVTVTRKLKPPLSHDEALDWFEELEVFPCAALDASLVFRGTEIAHEFKVSYWDGAIIAAAERLNAKTLYTEDLNHGQFYGTVQVINPFVAPLQQ
jgi:predicted nucleic acid-binding protein